MHNGEEEGDGGSVRTSAHPAGFFWTQIWDNGLPSETFKMLSLGEWLLLSYIL